MKPLTEQDSIFDGFCHRNFNEAMDGWRNELPDINDYPSVLAARDTLQLFEELKTAKRDMWALKRDLDFYKGLNKIS